jgi:hypothetical protein
MNGKNENIHTYNEKINSFKEKLTLWGARIKKENKVEIFELTKRVSDWQKFCQFNSTRFITAE